MKAVKSKGYRRKNKVVIRLKPNQTPELKTYSKIYQEKRKPKPSPTLRPNAKKGHK